MVTSSKRGLVSERNAFMENIGKITSQQGADCSFLIANARIWEWPIVFASQRFCATTGHHRTDIMNRPCITDFMKREYSNREALRDYREILGSRTTGQLEIKIYQKTTGIPMWFLIHVAPIKNDEQETVFFHLAFKDITDLKTPTDGDKAGVTKLGLFLNKIGPTTDTEINEAEKANDSEISNPKIAQIQKSFRLDPDTLPRYCYEKPTTPDGVINHFSNFKMLWDWLILTLTFHTVIAVPFHEAFHEKRHNVLPYDSVMDLFFMTDIWMNFRTTYVGPRGEIVSDYNLIKMKYSRCWLFCDLISCIPYDIINLFIPSSVMSSILNHCKVIKLLRVGKFMRKSEYCIEYGYASLVMLLIWFALFDHWMACLWYVIGWRELSGGNGSLPEQSWLASMGRTIQKEYILLQNGTITGGPSIRECYIASLYFTTTSLTAVGFGNISANTKEARIYCVVIMLFGAFLFAAIFGNITSIIQRMYSDDRRHHDRLEEIRQFRLSSDLPDSLAERILDFDARVWSKKKGKDIEESEPLVGVRRLASESCLRALATEFVITQAAPGDVLFHKGERVDMLCFVVDGSLEILQDGLIVAILHEGDVFGDVFWSKKAIGHSQYQVRTLTYCDLHSIKAALLLNILNFYPSFAKSFGNKMELTYNIRKRIARRTVAEIQQEREEELRRLNDPSCSELLKINQPVQTAVRRFKASLNPEDIDQSLYEGGENDESSISVSPQSLFRSSAGYQCRIPSEAPNRTTVWEEDVAESAQISPNDHRSTNLHARSNEINPNLGYDFSQAVNYFNVVKKDIQRQIQATNKRLDCIDNRLGQVLALLKARGNTNGAANVNLATDNVG